MSHPENLFDIAVLGIGHQGLIAACLLAKQGVRVAIIDTPTGVAGGGAYDMFAEGVRTGPVAHMPVPVNQQLSDFLELEGHGFEMNTAQTCSFAPQGLETGEYLFATSSRQATEREIAKFSVQDAETFMRLSDEAAELAGLLETVAQNLPAYDVNGWKDLWGVFETGRLLAEEYPHLQRRFVELLNGSLDRVLEQNFESDHVRGFLGLQSTVAGLTQASKKGSAASFVHALLGHPVARPYRGGWQPVRGTLHSYMKALTEVALALDVTFFPGAQLAKLTMAEGKIAEAILNDGTTVRASHFLADMNPLVLFDDFIEKADMPADFARTLEPMRKNAGFVRLKMAVTALPRFACLTGSNDASFLSGDIVLAPSLDYLTKARLESRSEGVPNLPAVHMAIPTILAPELSENGQHTLSILAQPFAGNIADTPDTRNAIATSVVRVLESFAPGFQGTITSIAVYMDQNLNRTLGPLNRTDLNAGHPLAQLFAARFGHHGLGYELPFANLTLCGYGPEASATAHVNRGGESAAAAVLAGRA